MNIVEAWREAAVGERVAFRGLDGWLEKGKHSWTLTPQELESDECYIVGRYPVPTEPGKYWRRCPNGGCDIVAVVRGNDGRLWSCGCSVGSLDGWGPLVPKPEGWE